MQRALGVFFCSAAGSLLCLTQQQNRTTGVWALSPADVHWGSLCDLGTSERTVPNPSL